MLKITRSVTLNGVKGLSGIRYEILPRTGQDDLLGQIASSLTSFTPRNDSHCEIASGDRGNLVRIYE